MLFTAYTFPLFFLSFALIYFFLSHSLQSLWIFVASCYFYMLVKPEYIFILFFLILIDYFCALGMTKVDNWGRRSLLWLSLISNLGILFTFKYFNLFNSTLHDSFAFLGHHYCIPNLAWLLPVGLSFHTFQSLSYIFEVYYRRVPVETRLDHYALYVMFWPQLVAGPIERPQGLLPQFKNRHEFVPENVVKGIRLLLLGYFKKLVVADRLAIYVDSVYDHVTQYSGISLMVATLFFSIQIYGDFSGYTDIARGCAKILGFDLTVNFAQPYLATSIADFWRRWHISLSSWFRDYVYFPLGGNRLGIGRTCINILIVFAVSGLWHGANWTFLCWGLLHAFFLIVEIWGKRFRFYSSFFGSSHWLSTAMKSLVTFLLVSFAWIFFRASSVSNAWYVISHLFQFRNPGPTMNGAQFIFRVGLVTILGLVEYLQRSSFWEKLFSEAPRVARWSIYYGTIAIIFFLGIYEGRHFIYFQF